MPKKIKNSYWQERFEKRKREGMVEAEAFNKKMAKRYKYIMQTLEKDVNYWYKRYAKENNLSLIEARKQLRAGELEAFNMTLEEYTTIAKDEHLSKELDNLLKNASLRVRVTREEELYITFAVRVEQALRVLNQDFKSMLANVYDDSYYKALYEVQSVVGYTATRALPDGAIDTALSNPWASDGKIFSTRIWENQNRLINTLRYELAQSLILQEGGALLVGRIQHRFDVSFTEARRLVETETAFIQEQAFIDSMETLNVKQYQIIATLDNRTSPICRKLDLKIFDLKDAKPGVTTPPFHCYCRSTTAPYIEGIGDLEDTRVYRDEDGKTQFTNADDDYEKWYNKYVKNTSTDDLLGLVTSNGIKITKVSMHQQERADLRGLDVGGVKDALINPLHVGEIEFKKNGPSQRFIGERVTVNVNPETGVIITSWATGRKKVKKYKKEGEKYE